MNLDQTFPKRIFMSRRDRNDRRDELSSRFERAGIANVSWFPAIECNLFKNDTRGFLSLAKRSCALGKRIILRQAALSRVSALLFFEDDVVFHPDFKSRMEVLELPKDWGMFYFGCQHIKRPEWVSDSVVRVGQALDMHAFAIRSDYFLLARKAMRGRGRGAKSALHSDLLLSNLHSVIPTYAAYPNLAWQSASYSDNSGRVYSNYHGDGRQKFKRAVLSHLEIESSHPIYRLWPDCVRSPRSVASLDKLQVVNISFLLRPGVVNANPAERIASDTTALRLFLETSATHAIIISDDIIVGGRQWIRLDDFDYFQPYASLDEQLGTQFNVCPVISEEMPPAYIASRAYAKSFLKLTEGGVYHPNIHALAARGLKIGSYDCNGVIRDLAVAAIASQRLKMGSVIQNRHFKKSESLGEQVNVTFCTLCKNRKYHLEATLRENLAVIRGKEASLIIVDWHSDDGLPEWIRCNFTREFLSGTLHYYELLDIIPFSIPIGKNFSNRLSTGKIVVNLDADNFIGDLLQGIDLLNQNEFLACDEIGNGSHGRIAFHNKDLQRLNGYNEKFQPAGYHDVDLGKRATKIGLRKKNWPCNRLPIQHSKSETVRFAGGGGLAEWRAMERHNASLSQYNLACGEFIANSTGLQIASFRYNFNQIVSLPADCYFLSDVVKTNCPKAY